MISAILLYIYDTSDITVTEQKAKVVNDTITQTHVSSSLGAWIFAVCILSILITAFMISIWSIDKKRLIFSGKVLKTLTFNKFRSEDITGRKLFVFSVLLVLTVVSIISGLGYFLIYVIVSNVLHVFT